MLNDDEFLKLVDEYQYSYKIGDIVKGRVISYEGNDVLVDISAKTSAVCPYYEVLLEAGKNIKDILVQGEEYEFTIISSEDEEGVFKVSQKRVSISRNYEILEEKFKNNEILSATVQNVVKGGVIVYVAGIKGFIPLSQLKSQEIKAGDAIEVKILSINKEENNLILSNKKIYEEEMENVKKETLDKIELNMVVKGEVVRITDFGAFVDIGGIDGLLPLSQMSWKWIDKPTDMLNLNDKIEVEIIGIDKEKQRVSLSIKSLEENPWLKASDTIKDDMVTKGKITGIKSFGIFVEVYKNVEGLLNKSQIKEYVKKFNKDPEIGDEFDVLIKKFDVENQKINLEIADFG